MWFKCMLFVLFRHGDLHAWARLVWWGGASGFEATKALRVLLFGCCMMVGGPIGSLLVSESLGTP